MTPLHYESGEVTEDIEVCEKYDNIWSSDSDGVPDLDFLKNTSTRSGRVIKCEKYSQYIYSLYTVDYCIYSCY